VGVPVLILGESGSGKSASLRNFSPDEVGIFNVASKPLPFKKKLNKVDNASYALIEKVLSDAKLKRYVIDDGQYLMSFELFNRAKEVGYGKFVDIAVNFKNMIDTIVRKTPTDCIVYILMHTEKSELGIKAKTIGKMLDSNITLEGLFSIVLRTKVENGKYSFTTQTDGLDTVKSPMGLFDTKEIDNDLAMVDSAIRSYWDLDKTEKAKEGK
jgi:hypothetical protein